MDLNFRLSDINGKIKKYLSLVSVGIEPINELMINDTFIPKEGLLWDYKENVSGDNNALAKTVLQIVSFYNTCGGYLIYGIKEVIKDKQFIPVNIDLTLIKPAQLRDKIKNYTGVNIDFTFKEVPILFDGKDYILGLIHIPKRPRSIPPVSFIKNGPEKKKNIFLFKSDQTYFRCLDECKPATTPSNWQVLFSDRDYNPVYGIDVSKNFIHESAQIISHDLPDKNLICSDFIGRNEALSRLWEWLADDLEYTKILSGDGGKGKTSIAYEFCRTFIQSPPEGYERVVWLSVKEKQFSAINNEFFDLNESDFVDCITFYQCLAEHCAEDISEYKLLSHKQIKRNLSKILDIFPSLYIVDDIDSLEEDEQRKVVDSCRQLGSDKVRFLITTRKKFGYSSDLCVDIDGLDFEEFSSYVDSLIDKYDLNKINTKEKKSLYKASDGSPLLSASILRLYKQGIPLQRAILDWNGAAGEDARNAALSREINSLSQESKRVLLTISYFKNCSFTEVKQATGIERVKLVDCLEELQSLFLVNEPKIIDSEQRFTVSNTTYLLVSAMSKDLAFDYNRLNDVVRRMKYGSVSKKSGNRRIVGLAINQSIALLKDGKVDEALETVENELKNMKDNPDLLLMKARCLDSVDNPDYEKIRKILVMSHKNGQKKSLLFEIWYKIENKLGSSNGIIEVAQKALDSGGPEDVEKARWYGYLANGYILRSGNRSHGVNELTDSELNDLMDASSALYNLLRCVDDMNREMKLSELNGLHDFILEKLKRSDSFTWLSRFDVVYKIILRGDTRTSLYLYLYHCISEAKKRGNKNKKRNNAIEICNKNFISLLDGRSDEDKKLRPFTEIIDYLYDYNIDEENLASI